MAERIAEGGEAPPSERFGWGGLRFAAELGRLGEYVIDLLRASIFEADRGGDEFGGHGHARMAELRKSVSQHDGAAIDRHFAMHDAQPVEGRHDGFLLGPKDGGVVSDRGERGGDREIRRNRRAHRNRYSYIHLQGRAQGTSPQKKLRVELPSPAL